MITDHGVVWATLVVTAVGTYLTRASFLSIAGRFRDLPPRVEQALSLIPPAVLAALVAPSVLVADGSIDPLNARLAAAALAAWAGYATKSVVVTLVVGTGALMVIDALV
jgi:branched-subunit amino acid transport protein